MCIFFNGQKNEVKLRRAAEKHFPVSLLLYLMIKWFKIYDLKQALYSTTADYTSTILPFRHHPFPAPPPPPPPPPHLEPLQYSTGDQVASQ